jgi:hypothetical protein
LDHSGRAGSVSLLIIACFIRIIPGCSFDWLDSSARSEIQIAGHVTVTIDEGKNNLIEKLFTFNQPFNVNTSPWSVSFQWAETGNELVRFLAFTELAV